MGHELWHQCEKDSWEMEVAAYFAFSEFGNRPIIPKWRCEICFAQPPDSIVAVWALLEPDTTSEEVQEVLAAEESRKRYELHKDDPDWVDTIYDSDLAMLPGWDDQDALDDMWSFLGG
jgi:hypothetical protein